MDHQFDIQLNNKIEYFRESSTCSIELSSHLHNHLVSKTILSKTLSWGSIAVYFDRKYIFKSANKLLRKIWILDQ